jgi:hypothetical protein
MLLSTAAEDYPENGGDCGLLAGYPDAMPNEPTKTERRQVRSEDPALSSKANELLTRELQEAVGADEVVVPKNAPRRKDDEHPGHSPFVATLVSNRPIIVVTFLVVLVLGGIVAMVTDQYWAVVLAAALHAIGTLITAAAAIHLTTETEHVAPSVAARLEEEGVADPDRVLSELVEDFAGAQHARGVPEVISSGHNERTTTADDDRARSALEQRSAITPSSAPTSTGGSGSAMAALEWWVVLALAILSIGVAVVIGNRMWALPAIILPLAAGWVALQYWLAHGSDAEPKRSPGDDRAAMRRLLPIGGFVLAGVIWFMVVAGWLGDLL